MFLQATPSVVAFVLGMDDALGLVSYFVVELTEALTRASVALHLVAATLLGIVGLRLLLRRSSLQRAAPLITGDRLRQSPAGAWILCPNQ